MMTMFRRKPQLIVPIRDRRQRRRVLTLKNFGKAAAAVAAMFAVIIVYANVRHMPAGEYGRLFGKQVAAPDAPIARKTDVVSEGRVQDQTAPDPMLVATGAGEQVLMANSNVPNQPPATQTTTAFVAAGSKTPVVIGSAAAKGVSIVGDGDGLAVVGGATAKAAPQQRPVLGGGIFKQQ
jgi:hypothetical protein